MGTGIRHTLYKLSLEYIMAFSELLHIPFDKHWRLLSKPPQNSPQRKMVEETSVSSVEDFGIVAAKNDEARKRLFKAALERCNTPVNGTTLHQIVRSPRECLNLSVGVDELTPESKRALFQACLDIQISNKWVPNTFNPACDPENMHEMAEIAVEGVERIYMKINYIESYTREYYPDDLGSDDIVRCFTLCFTSEY